MILRQGARFGYIFLRFKPMEFDGKKLGKSLLKSMVQKHVRRGSPSAVRTAKAWMEVDLEDFLRRLPIIVLEDAILHPDYDRVVELMVKGAKEAKLTDEDKGFLLGVVDDLARVRVKDSYAKDVYARNNMPVGMRLLTFKEKDLLDAIRLRTKHGGMPGDMMMLRDFRKLWHSRFSTDWRWTKRIEEYYEPRSAIDCTSVGEMEKDDVEIAGVDFHCSPIAYAVLKKPTVREKVKELFGKEKDAFSAVKVCIWHKSSGVNTKQFIGEVLDADQWLDYDKRYDELWKKIESLVEELQIWWVRKQVGWTE